jgi:hypothetical protein
MNWISSTQLIFEAGKVGTYCAAGTFAFFLCVQVTAALAENLLVRFTGPADLKSGSITPSHLKIQSSKLDDGTEKYNEFGPAEIFIDAEQNLDQYGQRYSQEITTEPNLISLAIWGTVNDPDTGNINGIIPYTVFTNHQLQPILISNKINQIRVRKNQAKMFGHFGGQK